MNSFNGFLNARKPIFSGVLGLFMFAGFGQNTWAVPQKAAEKTKITQCHVKGLEAPVKCVNMQMPLDRTSLEGDRTNSEAVKINVTAVIIPALGAESDPDPIVILAGGPGQAASDFGSFATKLFSKAHKNKDIILFDVRGTGLSTPLICPKTSQEDALETSEEKQAELLGECLRSFEVDVRHFTSYDQIQDMEDFRKRMGYSQFNFWGGSFGTRMAQHYIQFYPKNVRSAIMDGAISTATNLIESFPVSEDYALNILFENCEKNTRCQAKFPNFRTDFAKLNTEFSGKNIEIEFTDPVTWVSHKLKTSGAIFTNVIRGPLYNEKMQSMLPFVVDQALNSKNYDPLVALVTGFSSSTDGMAMGSMLSVLCAEDVPNVNERVLAKRNENSITGGAAAKAFLKSCKEWPVKKIPAEMTAETKSDVPALIISGRLDPVTPPALGQIVADNFTNSKHIIVKHNAHISSFYACMPKILNEFIENLKTKEIDVSCLNYKRATPFAVGFGGPVAVSELTKKDIK
jgi:pimeloyl-ACP methyl ester carboxylesterase